MGQWGGSRVHTDRGSLMIGSNSGQLDLAPSIRELNLSTCPSFISARGLQRLLARWSRRWERVDGIL